MHADGGVPLVGIEPCQETIPKRGHTDCLLTKALLFCMRQETYKGKHFYKDCLALAWSSTPQYR